MRLCTALVLITITASCAAPGGERDHARGAQSSKDHADNDDDDTWKVHELEVELRVATLEAEAKLTRAEREVADGQLEVAHAERDLATFETERSIRIAGEDLDMDRSRNNVAESQMELDELIAMYDADQFATTTKELVISRSRARLEFSRRGLEIAEREHRLLIEVELPTQGEELTKKLDEARFGLEMARHDLQVAQIENKLELERKQRELDEARKESGGDA